jgi:hypothetical protein
MSGNYDALMRWLGGFKNDVAALLMDDGVAPTAAKHLDQVFAAQVAWNLRA